MITEKALRNAAKEMNDVMGLDPEINPKASASVLKEAIVENMADIEEGDEFSEETQAVFDELKPKKGSKKAKVEEDEEEEEETPKKGKKAEKEEEPEEEEETEEEEEEEKDDDIRDKVEEAEKLSQLKTLVKENSTFKSLREDLAGYKDVDDLRDAMIDILDEEEEEADETAKKIHDKNVGKKKVNEVKSKKVEDEEEDEEEEEKPKAKDKKKGGTGNPNFKREGSMAQFMDETVKEGGSWEDIFAAISKEAKKRGVKTTLATIKAHVKFRVSKDPKFLGKLKIKEDGIE